MDTSFELGDARALLSEVERAISKILAGGQSYKIGTRSVTRADLSALMNLREKLLAETEQSEDGFLGRTSVAVFDRR